ncbi:sulfatase-like hydrolase/transferase [Dyadobacter diqingensis]|uniref:sulfatase-like hydrolase/transferase n=1 Tax=Dyadobacter diqingensis TaxID=2938121 RepID=UPI0020C19A7E|nr:sulfatase-like hydrolase/transferase [Dyadobacter diqingensis]
MMNIRFKLLILAVLISARAIAQAPDRPNILWIVSEDNSPFIGAYGDKFATTPAIDQLAREGILYQNAFCTAAVCAPSRATLITGMYPSSLGTEHMRSSYPVPDFVKFFPRYLRETGYYTTNNAKKDYNTIDQLQAWDESSNKATYLNRKPGQPFFAVFNLETTHESSIFSPAAKREMYSQFAGADAAKKIPFDEPVLRHDPEKVRIPPYHPQTPEMKHDWALYYDKIQEMDTQVDKLLKDLEKAGLADNTIVFYYADNGGVLGRSKRFMNESGLRIPLIIRIPEKYRSANTLKPGSVSDRLVDFVDFAPTVLSLAGITIPQHLQGKAFLGAASTPDDAKKIAFGSRGRMDAGIDLVRTVRDKKYRYVANFMPHRIYGQHIKFMWMATSMQSWEREFRAGKLNDIQSAFFREKPSEELYNVSADPDNIVNLAGKEEFRTILEKLRKQTYDQIITLNDPGFIPEAGLEEISKTGTPYDYVRSTQYDVRKVLETAVAASSRNSRKLPLLIKKMQDKNPVIRYWAATGALILGAKAKSASKNLTGLLDDPQDYVQIAAAEALYHLGEKEKALAVFFLNLGSDNTMLRVQILSALTAASPAELAPIKPQLAEIVKKKKSEYDANAAAFLIEKLDEPIGK